MAYNGKWTLTSNEGDVDAFLSNSGSDSTKIADGVKAAYAATGPGGFEVEYDISGDTYTRKVYFKGEVKKVVSGKFGEEVDAETFDGRPSKVVVTTSGNVMKRVEKIGAVERVGTFKVTGNEGLAEIECGGVTIVRRFTKA